MNKELLKEKAALKAVEYIEDGMILGLGTGSTVFYALKGISEKLKKGELKNIAGIPTSLQTEKLAKEFNIPLTTLDKHPAIDLTIDGADEVDKSLNLIKGGGGALLREKIIAQASKKVIIIVDNGKLSANLGEKWHLPVEVIKMAVESEKKFMESIGAEVKLRLNGDKPFITDEGNFILDANFGVIKNPAELAAKLDKRAGIVEHGLFIDIAGMAISAGDEVKLLIKN